MVHASTPYKIRQITWQPLRKVSAEAQIESENRYLQSLHMYQYAYHLHVHLTDVVERHEDAHLHYRRNYHPAPHHHYSISCAFELNILDHWRLFALRRHAVAKLYHFYIVLHLTLGRFPCENFFSLHSSISLV